MRLSQHQHFLLCNPLLTMHMGKVHENLQVLALSRRETSLALSGLKFQVQKCHRRFFGVRKKDDLRLISLMYCTYFHEARRKKSAPSHFIICHLHTDRLKIMNPKDFTRMKQPYLQWSTISLKKRFKTIYFRELWTIANKATSFL